METTRNIGQKIFRFATRSEQVRDPIGQRDRRDWERAAGGGLGAWLPAPLAPALQKGRVGGAAGLAILRKFSKN